MKSTQSWFGNQVKSYVMSNIPSWQNLNNNPASSNRAASTSTKPLLSSNYISVTDGFEVQSEIEVRQKVSSAFCD